MEEKNQQNLMPDVGESQRHDGIFISSTGAS